VQVITAIFINASNCFTAYNYYTCLITANNSLTPPDVHHILAPFIIVLILFFVSNGFCPGLVIAICIPNTLSKEDVMKRFMQMFEDIMVAVAFAEEGVSPSFLSRKDNLNEELEEQAWDLM